MEYHLDEVLVELQYFKTTVCVLKKNSNTIPSFGRKILTSKEIIPCNRNSHVINELIISISLVNWYLILSILIIHFANTFYIRQK